MPETFILIPGRTSRQGTTLNEGKLTKDYLQETGTVPPGVDNPEVFGVRAGGIILPRGADWLQATAELRQAFVDHPELDPSIVG